MSNVVKISKAKRKSKSHAGFLGFVLVILVVCFFLLSPIFSIESIEVIGNSSITSNYIVSSSGILYGENILRINKFNAVDKVNSLPVIKSASIKRIWPNKLVITVEEKEAIAEIKFYGSKLCVSEAGDVIKVVTDDSVTGLPILEGITVKDVIVGEYVECNEKEKLEKYLFVLNKLKENDMLSGVKKLTENDGILVHFEIGHVAFLGDIDNLQYKVAWLKSVWEKEETPSYIDLHNLDKVVTRPVWGLLDTDKGSDGLLKTNTDEDTLEA